MCTLAIVYAGFTLNLSFAVEAKKRLVDVFGCNDVYVSSSTLLCTNNGFCPTLVLLLQMLNLFFIRSSAFFFGLSLREKEQWDSVGEAWKMQTYGCVSTQHQTLVHDVEVDPTGRYAATCSSDRSVKVFIRDPRDSLTWRPLCSAQEHNATVQRIAWAHPSFGTILATCSSDQSTVVYELCRDATAQNGYALVKYKKIKNTEKDIVTDVAFAPRQHGLVLATACNDGFVRIYTVTSGTFKVPPLPPQDDDAPPPSHPVAVHDGILSVSWCPSVAIQDIQLAVGAHSGRVTIRRNDANKKWLRAALYPSEEDYRTKQAKEIRHDDPVCGVAWAPCIGRRYHLVASCSRRGLKILKLSPLPTVAATQPPTPRTPSSPLSSEFAFLCQEWSSPSGAAQIAWNRSATVLSCITDDQRIRLLRQVHSTAGFEWVDEEVPVGPPPFITAREQQD